MATDPYFEDKFSLAAFQDKRWWTAALAGVAGVAVLIGYFQSGPRVDSYLAAEEAVAKWEASGDEEAFFEMKKALRKVPDLEQKYEAAIAQKLFMGDKLSEALILAHDSLQRIEGDAPYHASYGETTLLIEQGSYQQALERSVGLKEKMARECRLGAQENGAVSVGDFLYAHNLLRIACLQKELSNRPGEKAAWEELETFLKGQTDLSQQVLGNFREKGLDLSHYIAERKKQL